MKMQKHNPSILLFKILHVFEGQKDFDVHFYKNLNQIELIDQTTVTIYSTWVEEKKGIFAKSTPQYFWGQKPTFKEEIDYFIRQE